MRARPVVVAFDVVETLFSLEPVRVRIQAAGGGPEALELFFARMVHSGSALAAAGGFHRFPELADAALSATLPRADADARREVLAGFRELPAYPDAAPAMERLAAAGVRITALTNGGVDATTHLLTLNRLDGYVERVVSVDEVRRWKPAADVYRHAAKVTQVAPGDLALVAVHAWDVHGARRAGLVTGWAARLEGRFSPVFDRADVEGADLVEVVDGLLRLPSAAS